jgi:trk system potassium uptake protein TrkH
MSVPIHLRVKSFFSRYLSPARIFVLSFATVITTGGVFLWLPFSAGKGPIRFVDALFTSTSAVCVTGLTVLDTGKDYSFAGQVITALLIQVGGLGIITISTVFFVLMGRGISFKGREIVQSTFLHTPRRDFIKIAKAVLLFTGISELSGAIFLFLRFSRDFPFWTAVYQSVYHSVSAFNNAGFSLFTDNLIGYQGDWIVNLAIMGLIIHGGIGFIVQYEIVQWVRGLHHRLSVHTRIVLITTTVLIAMGALLIFLFERHYIIKEVSWGTKVLICLFQSVTPRTAGFNTVDIGLMQNDSILLLMILMFIGASPGSTGGGVKTTSAAIVVLALWNRLRGIEEVNIFNRTIPREIIGRTVLIIFASAFGVAVIASVLIIAGPVTERLVESRDLFVQYLFDTVSAFGTVGLSMGITPKLNDTQKYALILMMFAGRVGPLTLAFALVREKTRKGMTYAEEGVMVG